MALGLARRPYCGARVPRWRVLSCRIGLAAGLLCLLLVARITLVDRPFAGWSGALGLAAGALALFAAWILLSSGWSDSPARALTEFDRALLYLLVLVCVGLNARAPGNLLLIFRWVGLAMAVTCAVALATRLLPTTFPTSAGVNNERLAFPLTYWNAMGIFCGARGDPPDTSHGLGARARGRPRRGGGGLPIVAVTLYFTFSRGGIAAAIVGLVLYLVLAHPRGLAGRARRGRAAGRVCAARAYGSELLATRSYAGAAAREQARALLAVVIGCVVVAAALRVMALRLDAAARCGSRSLRGRAAGVSRPSGWRPARAAIATVAADLPGRLDDAARAFAKGDAPPGGRICAHGSTTVGNNGRLAIWRVALDAFEQRAAARRGCRDLPAVLGARPRRSAGAGRRRPLALLRDAGGARLARPRCCSDRARCAARRGGATARGPERHGARRLPGCRLALLAPRGGRLGLGDARAVRLVLRRRGRRRSRRPRRARGRCLAGPARAVLAGLACLPLAITP